MASLKAESCFQKYHIDPSAHRDGDRLHGDRAVCYMSPGEIVSNLFRILTAGPDSVDPQIYSVLINVRLPRIILAVLCGAGLAVSGAAFQSIFSNALATPDTLGVAAGSSFGAALALLLKAWSNRGTALPRSQSALLPF